MKTFTEVAVIAAIMGLVALIAAVILMPRALGQWLGQALHAALGHTEAMWARVRDRLRTLLRPRGPRFRPPRFA